MSTFSVFSYGANELFARVFEIVVLDGPRCKSPRQLISFVQDPKAILDILTSLKKSAAPPEVYESEH